MNDILFLMSSLFPKIEQLNRIESFSLLIFSVRKGDTLSVSCVYGTTKRGVDASARGVEDMFHYACICLLE